MTNSTYDTALILFSRTAAREAELKQFNNHKNVGLNRRIAEKLIDHSIKIAKETKLPFYIVDETLQRGNSFGSRLCNAIADQFAKGYSKVIVIGNDCPAMNAKLITKAATALQTNHAVAGPTSANGLYLIGLDKSLFNTFSFSEIRWQSPNVLEDFRKFSGKQIPTLTILDDINNEEDLQIQLRDSKITSHLRLLIKSYLAGFHDFISYSDQSKLNTRRITVSSLRGPPHFVAC